MMIQYFKPILDREELNLLEFSNEERNSFREILNSDLFRKAFTICNQKRPPVFDSVHDYTVQEADRKLARLQGWELYQAALLSLTIPQKEVQNKELEEWSQ